jgi:hypothetical protein
MFVRLKNKKSKCYGLTLSLFVVYVYFVEIEIVEPITGGLAEELKVNICCSCFSLPWRECV